MFTNLSLCYIMGYPETEKVAFLMDALYCEEEQWGFLEEEEEEEEEEERFCRDEIDAVLGEQDLFWEDDELCSLFSKEQESLSELRGGFEGNLCVGKARKEGVEWVLKVVSYYCFSAQTALLAVNYLDGFLCSLEPQTQKPWTSQLAAVACLSLAAKVEEIHVPLLLDFQVEESKYMFEAKTIQRMELLILSNRQWKMNPVTPFSFLDYIARRLGLKNPICCDFLRRCERVLLSIIPDCRFKCYLPSETAAATMLHVIGKLQPSIGEESQEQLLSILGTNKEKLEECRRLIKEAETRMRSGWAYNKRKFGMGMPLPRSPKGVMDVSFSSEDWNDSSVSSSPEPLSKRTKNTTTSQD
ncbi:cyclin-D3-1-like [Ipomoea triloba]|uniref:cyclin-D3-1-like n=1 Tax=Ipomoea triloba TaxID=35885 RepID=UPI00125DF8B5|nr:cyclin-D3-1-like [Ipomoea triloba]